MPLIAPEVILTSMRARASSKRMTSTINRIALLVTMVALMLPLVAADECVSRCNLSCSGITECEIDNSSLFVTWCRCKLKSSFIIGMAVGGSLAVIACIACCCYCCRRKTVIVHAQPMVMMQHQPQQFVQHQPQYVQAQPQYTTSPQPQPDYNQQPNYGSQPQPQIAQEGFGTAPQ